MGYESTFDYNFSDDVYIKDIEKLNREIGKLKYGMGEAKIIRSENNFYLEMDGFCGKFYDDKDFAELLSKYIVKGYVDLIYTGEDGARSGFRAYSNRVKSLKFTVKVID